MARGNWIAAPAPDRRRYSEERRERLRLARERATHTALEWHILKAIFEDCCVKCGSLGTVKDHIVPLHQDGSDGIENLQPLCGFCNTGKGREAIDYRQSAYPLWREHYAKVLACISSKVA